MLPQIIAGLASFAVAKMSGASTRNALISGLTGGVFSGGIQALSGLAGTTAGGVTATGIPFDPVTGMVTAAGQEGTKAATSGISGFLTKQFAENKELAKQVAGMGQGLNRYNVAYPAMAAAMTTKFDDYNPQFQGISDIDADKRAEEYGKAYAQMKPIIQGREYTFADRDYSVPYKDIVFGSPVATANQGGIINALPKYNQGGVNYLPSKIDHDEKDINNYVRAHGYVEDGSGNGDKDEDTMLAQLADGEFVSRADAVLGAGIMAGANPEDFKEMRKKGAAFFYNQQDQMKRIYDLINAN
jgi:hypothetical protein|tara:strand:+ start:2044 stop:2943 length:900 start_codon:yes stop_codon:yes gene_type:complete